MKKFLLLLTFVALSSSSFTQAALNDSTFNPSDIGYGNGDGFSYDVHSVAIQSDGKMIVGGEFTTYNKSSANRIIRLNTDGTRDTSFHIGSGLNYPVYSIAIQSDGKIIVAGDFTEYNGSPIKKIARLNSDGSLDSSFDPIAGSTYAIYDVAIQNDGKIVIGGKFNTFNWYNRSKIARLNSDGSLDLSFDPGTGFNSDVNEVAIQNDGKILVGGNFTSFDGAPLNKFARLNSDGTIDAAFNIGTGFNNNVESLAIQSDGKILVGGNFSQYNGTSTNKITRLNADGTFDISFDTGTGCNFEVYSITIQSDDKIIIGGAFTEYNSITSDRIARLNTNGTLDSSFDIGNGFFGKVYSLAIQNDGKIIAGGTFTQFSNSITNYFVRLNTNGSMDITLNPGSGLDDKVWGIAVQNDGKIIVVGDFTFFNASNSKRIVRLNPDGTIDNTFNAGTGFQSGAFAVSIQNDGKILVGGVLKSYNGTPVNGIARLNTDGTLDNTFNTGSGFEHAVYSINIQSDEKIIVQGQLISYNGATVKQIVRLNTDGTLDTSFNVGGGVSHGINSLALQSNDKIVIGGNFEYFDGTPVNRIARLNTDGTLDNTFSIGAGFNDDVNSVAIQNNDKIIAAGLFTMYDGTYMHKIARLNQNGTIDSTFNSGLGFSSRTNMLVLQDDGKIVAGGHFTSYDGTPRSKIARLNTDGSLDSAFDPGSGFTNNISSHVRALAIQNDHKILVGGEFISYDTIGRNRIARLLPGCINTSSVDIQTACNSFTWIDGNTYISSNNVATHTLTNVAGCDSIISLDLTINYSNSDADTQIACDSFTWIDGNTYMSSNNTATHTLTNVAGCDSVVTLNLTINNSDSIADTVSTCSSYTWSVDGNTYSQSGLYTAHYTNQMGCDSIHTLDLTIDCSLYGNVSVTNNVGSNCDGEAEANVYGGVPPYSYIYSTGETSPAIQNLCSGVYYLTISDSDNNSYETTFVISDETINYDSDSTYLDYVDSLFSSATDNCDYDYSQPADSFYVDQNNIIQLDQNIYEATWYVFQNTDTFIFTNVYYTTEDINGSFAYTLTIYCEDVNRSILKSVTFVYKTRGTASTPVYKEEEEDIILYPNPATDIFRIDIPKSFVGEPLVLTNSIGQIVMKNEIKSTTNDYNISGLANGTYFVEIKSASGTMVKKLQINN